MRKTVATLLVVALIAPLPIYAAFPDAAPGWFAAPVLGIPGSMALIFAMLFGVLAAVAIDRSGGRRDGGAE